MADLRKFLDQAGVGTLWAKIKAADEANLQAAKGYADDQDVINLQAAKEYADGIKTEIVENYATKAELEAETDRATKAEQAIDAKVTKLIGADANKSVREIAAEELAEQLIAENATESLDTLAEIATWIQEHPEDAAAMNKAIEDIEKDLTDHYLTSDAILEDFVARSEFNNTVATLATKEELSTVSEELERLDGYTTSWVEELSNSKVDVTALKALAYKDKVAESDLEADLAAKINGKANATDLKALAYKDTVATNDIDSEAVTFDKLANDIESMLLTSLNTVGVRNDDNGNHIFYTMTNGAVSTDKKDFWTVPVITAAEIEEICQ